jgi:hypothetical protein
MHLTRIWPVIPPKWNFTRFSRRAAAFDRADRNSLAGQSLIREGDVPHNVSDTL